MVTLAILVSEDMVDLTSTRMRDEGLEVTIKPPCTILVDCEAQAADHMTFFPGLSEETSGKVVASLMGISFRHLSTTLLPGRVLLPTFPFDSKSDGSGLHVMYGNVCQMLYNVCAGPSAIAYSGPLVMFRATEKTNGWDLLELGDIDFLERANEIMSASQVSWYADS